MAMMVRSSILVSGIALCGGVIAVVLACLIARRTSLHTARGVIRILGSAAMIVLGASLFHPAVVLSNVEPRLSIDHLAIVLTGVLIAVASVATALVVVHQNATTLRWPLASICLGSALTMVYDLGNVIFARPLAATTPAIVLMLCATTVLGWAILVLAFPRVALPDRFIPGRCLLAAMLLCGGLIVFDRWGGRVFAASDGASIVERVGSVGVLTMSVSALALVATIFDRRVTLQRSNLVASQQLYRALYDGNPDAVFTLDLDGRFVSVNAATSVVLGHRSDQLIDRSLMSMLAPQFHESLEQMLALIATGTTRTLDVCLADSPQRKLALTGIPLRMDDAVVGVYGIARDTTAQHTLQAEIEGSLARYRSAFDYAPVGLAIVEPGGRYLAVNRALSQLLGWSEAELLLMSWLDLSSPEAFETEIALADELIAGTIRTHQSTLRFRHKDGHAIWAQRRMSLARDARVAPLFFICEIVGIDPNTLTEDDEVIGAAAAAA